MYCDMDIHGGGWSYVARGSNSLNFADSQAYGTAQTDPDVNTRWSFGDDVINELTAGGAYREILLTLGGNNNLDLPSHELFRLFRIPIGVEITNSDLMDADWSTDIEAWDGSSWNELTITCGWEDYGVCWSAADGTTAAGEVDFCCPLDSNNDLNEACGRGVGTSGYGAWIENGATDGSQYFGCHSSSADVSFMVMYVRNTGCVSTEVPWSDKAEANSIYGTEGSQVDVTCNVGHIGGGMAECNSFLTFISTLASPSFLPDFPFMLEHNP